MACLERLFWVAIVLLGVYGSSHMLMIFWNRHSSHPIRTTYASLLVPLDEIPFPTVSICPETAVMKSKLTKVLSTINLNGYSSEEVGNAVLELFKEHYFNVNKTALMVLDEVLYKNQIKNLNKFLDSVTPSCRDILIKCQWESEDFDCTSRFLDILTEHKRCCILKNRYDEDIYAFPKPNYNPYTQIDMGLTLVLNFSWDEFLPENSSSVKVYIHEAGNRNTRASVLMRIIPGIIMDIPFIARVTENTDDVRLLKPEERSCYFTDERTTGRFSYYTEAICKTTSKRREIINKCGYDENGFADKAGFDNATIYPCILHIEEEPIADECPTTCNSINYEIFYTSLPLMFDKSFPMNPLYDSYNMTSQTSIIYVHHGTDFHFKLVQQTITSAIYLLYSLGGVFGLILGCNFVSLAEIFYYIFLRLPINARKVQSQDKQSKHPFYLSDFKINEKVVSRSIKVKYCKEAFTQNN